MIQNNKSRTAAPWIIIFAVGLFVVGSSLIARIENSNQMDAMRQHHQRTQFNDEEWTQFLIAYHIAWERQNIPYGMYSEILINSQTGLRVVFASDGSFTFRYVDPVDIDIDIRYMLRGIPRVEGQWWHND